MDMKMILWAEEMMKNDYGKVLIWLAVILMLMAVDMITGFIQAYVNHDLKSGKMGTGLLKKFALLAVLVSVVPLTIVLPEMISVSVIIGVYVLETLNELVSVVENLNKMGIAASMFDPIIKRLQAPNNPDDKDGE
ncbi:phage holin family protein [Enterococcus dispar]|uniref:phage holin family protein n=1 Tax=Enterococcus dispar TaxID=44009 RepID=UPI0021D4167F|nr:phage holin family protein [Enterococcus dispar]MCU7356687.1 phage holin family protein [Enterococcus dispar]